MKNSSSNRDGHTNRVFVLPAHAARVSSGKPAEAFTSLALTGLLSQRWIPVLAGASRPTASRPFSNPLAPKAAALRPQGEKRDLPVHVWRAKPRRYVRLQADSVQARRPDHSRKDQGARRIERQRRTRRPGPNANFKQYGQSGQWVSELFPHLSGHVDDIAFLKSMTADSPIHGSAMLQMNSGKIQSGSPALGSWVNYGLGTVNENLPGFVVMLDPSGGPISGAKNWSSGYMPATYQGTILRSKGTPILDLNVPEGMTREMERELLDTLAEANSDHLARRIDNSDLAARISSYELAYKMQQHAPEAVDLAPGNGRRNARSCTASIDEQTADFGRRCLLARRLVERGVRFVQLYSGGSHNDANWDAHGDLEKNHNFHAGNTDQPIAGLADGPGNAAAACWTKR